MTRAILTSERALSNDERRALWASRYYAGGCHRPASKPRIRLAPAPRTARPACTDPLPPRYAFEGMDAADLPEWHPDSWHYAGP